MSRINGWKRQQHYATLDEAENHLDENGQVKIGVWTQGRYGRIEHVYEPSADEPFIVRTRGTDRSFDEEGRYAYRTDGDDANKVIMRRYP